MVETFFQTVKITKIFVGKERIPVAKVEASTPGITGGKTTFNITEVTWENIGNEMGWFDG